MVCGAAVPTLTASYAGFVNSDTSASLTTMPTLTTTATLACPAGCYDINVGGAADANYNISYVTGTLTVNPIATVATWSSDVDGPWNCATDWTDTQGIGAPGFSGVSGDQAAFNGAAGLNVDLGNFSPSIAQLAFGPSAMNYDIKSTGSGLLQLNNGNSNATISVSAGNQTIGAPVVLENDVNVTLAGGTSLTISGGIGQSGGSHGLILTGSGSLTLSGANSDAGSTVVTGGTLIVTSASELPSGSNLTVGANAGNIFAPSLTQTTIVSSDNIAATSGGASAATAVPSSTSVASASPVLSSTGQWRFPTALPSPPAPLSMGQGSNSSLLRAELLGTAQRLSVEPWYKTPSRSIAGDPAVLRQATGSSDNSDQQHKKDVAILALDAMFAGYGR